MKNRQRWIEFLKREVLVKISMGHGKFLCLFKKVGVGRPRLDFFVWSSKKSKVGFGSSSSLTKWNVFASLSLESSWYFHESFFGPSSLFYIL